MNDDKIVYQVFDEDATCVFVSYDKKEAKNQAGVDGVVHPIVVDVVSQRAAAAARLTPLDRLVLGINEHGNPVKLPMTYRGES